MNNDAENRDAADMAGKHAGRLEMVVMDQPLAALAASFLLGAFLASRLFRTARKAVSYQKPN